MSISYKVYKPSYTVKSKLFRKVYDKFICPTIGLVAYPFCLILNIRFVNVNITRIGHISYEPDCFIKEGLLGMRKNFHGVVLAPHDRVANNHIISYWKKYMTFIDSPTLRILLDPLCNNKLTSYNVSKYLSITSTMSGSADIQNKYLSQTPLLSLSELDYNRGWDALQKLGVPRTAWFVCIHCRENGYDAETDWGNRSSDIDNYFVAMKSIVEQGGWVIRMGDSTMKNIPQMEHVIDYAHSDIKSDWMDVFLCASCKLFVGGASGLYLLSDVFGVPLVIVNASPMSIVLPNSHYKNIAIPKLIWSIKENRYLTFNEVFNSKISSIWSVKEYADNELKVIDNSPDDISNAIQERLDMIDNNITYTDKDEQLQKRFISLIKPEHYSYQSKSRIGKDFLLKYEHLL